MKIEVEVVEKPKNSLFLHEEVATFEGGRVISVVGNRSIVVESDKHDVKFEFSVQNLLEALDKKVSL